MLNCKRIMCNGNVFLREIWDTINVFCDDALEQFCPH